MELQPFPWTPGTAGWFTQDWTLVLGRAKSMARCQNLDIACVQLLACCYRRHLKTTHCLIIKRNTQTKCEYNSPKRPVHQRERTQDTVTVLRKSRRRYMHDGSVRGGMRNAGRERERMPERWISNHLAEFNQQEWEREHGFLSYFHPANHPVRHSHYSRQPRRVRLRERERGKVLITA